MAGKKLLQTSTVLIDSDAFIAIARKGDANHKHANSVLNRLFNLPVRFTTTNYVFAECVTVISQRVGHDAALSFADDLKAPQSPILIERITDEIDDMALAIFSEQMSKNISFVDCTNMALVDRLGIDYIFSFDKAYRQNGYRLAEALL